ncbi:putative quinol monooxygenase [Paenibacillus sp. Y412MC10]|uniref:putative quinol monooxygenase n=1 Tax=Geobacillus sp. (strain Y412MC10) TaxID=481743 RepID=UPI0011AB6871|nr:putative quinol monooxygenase [Paenibacillus sp. Y412MC10]
MIIICAVLKAKPENEQSLRDELNKLIEPSRAEPGCVEYTLHYSLDNKGTFVFYESWIDEEALNTHLKTDHYQTYRKNVEGILDVREVYRLEKCIV